MVTSNHSDSFVLNANVRPTSEFLSVKGYVIGLEKDLWLIKKVHPNDRYDILRPRDLHIIKGISSTNLELAP